MRPAAEFSKFPGWPDLERTVVPPDRIKSSQKMQVYAVYLLNRAKRQGIGTRLLRSVMRQFLASGASSACVWTLRDAIPARMFYEHIGARFAAEKVEDRGIISGSSWDIWWADIRTQFSEV